jgi:hypothetical protein
MQAGRLLVVRGRFRGARRRYIAAAARRRRRRRRRRIGRQRARATPIVALAPPLHSFASRAHPYLTPSILISNRNVPSPLSAPNSCTSAARMFLQQQISKNDDVHHHHHHHHHHHRTVLASTKQIREYTLD